MTTMPPINDDYVTPYINDERLRRSVMAAQVGRISIREVYEREARRPPSRWRLPFNPEFDEEAFSSSLGMVTVVVEGLCVEGAEGWTERERIVVENPRGVSRARLGWPAVAPVVFGSDRAVCYLFFSFLQSLWAGKFVGRVRCVL